MSEWAKLYQSLAQQKYIIDWNAVNEHFATRITINRKEKMRTSHFSEQWLDTNGNPAGGVNTGKGFTISWQNGPLGRGPERKEPNGAFVEDIIQAVILRLQFYQESKFACIENASAIAHLQNAAIVLDQRTRKRIRRKTEGTHTV